MVPPYRQMHYISTTVRYNGLGTFIFCDGKFGRLCTPVLCVQLSIKMSFPSDFTLFYVVVFVSIAYSCLILAALSVRWIDGFTRSIETVFRTPCFSTTKVFYGTFNILYHPVVQHMRLLYVDFTSLGVFVSKAGKRWKGQGNFVP